MTRRRLVLAGGTVCYAAHRVLTTKRRQAGRSHHARTSGQLVALPVAVATLGFHLPSIDWGGFFGGIWSFLGAVTSGVRDFVFEVVQAMGDLLYGIIRTLEEVTNAAINGLNAGFVWLTDNAVNAAEAVAGVVADSYAMLDAAFSNLRQQLKDMLEHAWDDVLDFVRGLIPDMITDALGAVWDTLQALAGIGLDGIAFLVNLIDDPIGFLWALLRDVIQDAIDVAIAAAGIGIALAEQIVEQGLSIIFAGYGDIISVLKRIFHILEWMADHVDDFTVGTLETILDPSWQSIQRDIVGAVDENIDSFEALVRKIFGL